MSLRVVLARDGGFVRIGLALAWACRMLGAGSAIASAQDEGEQDVRSSAREETSVERAVVEGGDEDPGALRELAPAEGARAATKQATSEQRLAAVPAEEEALDRPSGAHVASIGARIIAGTSRAYPENSWVFGFGLTGEVHLGLGFEVGLGASALLGERSEVFPFEVFLRKAFELVEEVEAHLQGGAVAALVVGGSHGPMLLGGGAFAAGMTLWLRSGFGWFLEGTYQFVIENAVVHDIEGAVGVTTRFG